jgi:crotonobetainyl-CoA:carnitine CoA-transferase CaiB-like acyl-CoA transferase
VLDRWRIGKRFSTTPESSTASCRPPRRAAEDPQLWANDIVVPIEGAADLDYTVNNPVTLRGLARVPARRAPEHGEHNTEILAQLGFSADDIEELQPRGAIPVVADPETVR